MNAGVAALSTDVVVRFDGHCRPAHDYIARAAALIATPDIGVVGGVWVIEPGAKSLEAEAIAIAGAHPLGSGGAAYRSPSGSTPTDVDTVPFGCFKRSLWKEIGGFDERLESNEDYDFNYRIRQRGLRVVLDPAVRCTYYARSTIGDLARQYSRYGWWKARMLTHHPESIRWRQLVPALLVPSLLVAALGMILGGGDLWGRLLAAYPVAVLVGAVHAAARRDRWPAIGWLAGSFVTIHVAWSAAFWASLVSAGGIPHRGHPMSGGRVLTALGLIILATAVVPPLAAISVNRSRVRLASSEVASIAAALDRAGQQLRDTANESQPADVLCGPGRMPLAETPATERWVTTPHALLAAVVDSRRALSPDPWGNCYAVNVAATLSPESAVLWVLSAGPNGIIDTPFLGGSETPVGDDVGVRVR